MTASAMAWSSGCRPVRDERLVDLEAADRERLERRQARIAGAEIVDRQRHAHRFSSRILATACARSRMIRLSVTSSSSHRRQAAVFQRLRHALDQPLFLELARRHVDRDRDRRQAGFLPGRFWRQAVRSTHSPIATIRPLPRPA
jgi:hypothetical protein